MPSGHLRKSRSAFSPRHQLHRELPDDPCRWRTIKPASPLSTGITIAAESRNAGCAPAGQAPSRNRIFSSARRCKSGVLVTVLVTTDFSSWTASSFSARSLNHVVNCLAFQRPHPDCFGGEAMIANLHSTPLADLWRTSNHNCIEGDRTSRFSHTLLIWKRKRNAARLLER